MIIPGTPATVTTPWGKTLAPEDITFGCAVCAEVIEGEPVGMTLFPASDSEAWQQWFLHPRCARLIFAESMLAVDLREELAGLMIDE